MSPRAPEPSSSREPAAPGADASSGASPPLDPHPESSAEHLIVRVARGDRVAFEILHGRFAAPVLGVLTRIVKDRASAEDLLQDVFWHVWERADRFDPARGRAKVWLILIARSKAIDLVRRRKRERPRGREEGVSTDAEVAAPLDEDAVEREEQVHSVRRELAALPEDQRILIEASFLEGRTHAEIASALSLPLGTVKTRIRTGLAQLRAVLAAGHKRVSNETHGKEDQR